MFYKTRRGEVLYEPRSCRLKRLTAPQARTCLANKTIMFIGDSITRYQYMSFAHFLAHGVYPARYGDDPNTPSVCMEEQWNDWPDFFANSSRQLSVDSARLKAKETCNCSRIILDHTAYEDRRLELHMLSGPRPAHIRVLLYTSLVWPSIHTALHNTLHNGLRKNRNVDVAIVNVGAWLSVTSLMTMDQGLAAKTVTPAFALPKRLSRGTKTIWRSMSHGNYAHNVSILSDTFTRVAKAHNWTVLNSYHVSKQASDQGIRMMWDNMHFLPAMYDQWNDLLLHELCSKQPVAA